MAPGTMIYIQAALDHLQSCINKNSTESSEIKELQDFVLCRLRCLRTFAICSIKWGGDIQLMSLWGRLGDVARKILDDEFSSGSSDNDVERFLDNIKPLVKEMDIWFITLSDSDSQQSTSQAIDDILGSVVENFEDFLKCCDEDNEDVGHLIRPIEALKEYMIFLRNFLGFASLVCGDQHHEAQNLFSKIAGLAVSAAHLAVCIFFTFEDTIHKINSINSALQSRIEPFHNPQLCRTFSQALSSFRCSRELYEYPLTRHDPTVVMMDFIGYLLFLLWDMLHSDVSSIISLQPHLERLYDGLRFLRTLLRKLPNMFHGEIGDTARLATCNAGIIIFSICQSGFEFDPKLQEFLRTIMVIQSAYEEKTLSFLDTTVLAFLGSLLDYMKKVNSFKVSFSFWSCVPKIQEHLSFLISFMGILIELRKDQGDLYEGLWNLSVEVAFELELLVDQLVLGNILPSFSSSFLSIAADMRIIKTDASKIFDDKEKIRDIKILPHIFISIPSALDHLRSCIDRICFECAKSKGKKAAVDVIGRLRCLGTFVTCSTKLGINVELLSLWVRLDGVVSRILDDKYSHHSACDDAERFFRNMKPFVEEMDKWFIILSDYQFQQSNPAVAFTIEATNDLIGSVVENLENFLHQYDKGGHVLVGPIEALNKYLLSSRNFICFATLLGADQHQEVKDLFSQIEGLAISAAHTTVYLFVEGTIDGMKSIISALQLRINPFHKSRLYEAYSLALARINYSRDQIHVPIPHYPVVLMIDVIGYLFFLLKDMFEVNGFSTITLKSQLEILFCGLRSLIKFLKKLPCMFDGETRDITRAAICDAGVIIFSIHQNHDILVDRGLENFVRCIELIQLEFEQKRLLHLPNSTALDILDSSLDECCDPTVRADLFFLRSLLGKLVELRKHEEGAHESLWSLCVKLAYKYNFHVYQMIQYKYYLSMSCLSIAADMNVIKTASFNMYHDGITDEDHGDVEIAPRCIRSIDSALHHLQSYLNKADYENEIRKRKKMVFVMNKLRCLRTYVLCSTNLANDDELRILLVKLDNINREILNGNFDLYLAEKNYRLFNNCMDLHDEVIAEHFFSLSDHNFQQCSSSPMATRVKELLEFLSENLYRSFTKSSELEVFEDRRNALKENITFLTNFITFASLIYGEQRQEVRDIFSKIEVSAVTTAHLTVFRYTQRQGIYGYVDESIISLLQLGIRPFQNPHFYALMLHTKDDPLIVMMNSLLSLLWNELLSEAALVVPSQSQLEKMDSGLRSLKALLRKHKNNFDEKVMDMMIIAIHDIGVMFSLDHQDFEIDRGLQEFQVILKRVEEKVVPTSAFTFPRTIMLGFLNFLLEYITEVESSNYDSDTLNCVSKIQEDLIFLRLLMGKLVELRDHQDDIRKALWNRGAAAAYQIEFLIDQLVLVDIADSFPTSVQSVTEDLMIIRKDSKDVFNARRQEINVQKITCASIDQVPSQSSMPIFNDFVGFKPEQTSITNRLRRGPKKLQIVAIVGMPGLGKTTLATKVYNEPSVVNHFSVRAWCSVSHVFNKRKVLLELLHHIKNKPPNAYDTKTVNDLAEEFCRSLKGRRYLIYMDDVWDMEAYNWLQMALPENSTGSRIILTTRHGNVATLDDKPVYLSQFTSEESLELLRGKVFPDRKDWPPEIHELGMQIAESCKGLPLTIVIVAGLLTTSKQEVWVDVLHSLRSGVVKDQCERTIELSYNYLPDHLKRCFLSFSAFPEDHEISVKRLIWMWIAEGFIQKSESKSLEEAATDVLKDLIGRSLVMNAKERSVGGVKACRIHDLLLDFCLKKANEESYMHKLEGHEDLLSFDDPANMRRLCILSGPHHFKKSKMYWPRLRSLLFFGTKDGSNDYDMSFLFRIFKLLRVLDMERVCLRFKSPSGIGFLVPLRYLAIQTESDLNPSIGNLTKLETFILKVARGQRVTLPDTFWNLRKLRHLYSINEYSTRGIEFPVENLESASNFVDLDCLSTLHSENWDILEKQLSKFPNIRRLKCRLSGDWICGMSMSFPCLIYLGSLSLSFDVNHTEYELTFPKTIKQLTLDRCRWPWPKVSGIAGLPCLEVLKLLHSSFVGDMWHVEEDEFPKLRVLKLSYLDIVNWTASDDQFLNLEKLVLDNCHKLREIPDCLETVDALELIEVINCSDCIGRSVKKVEEYQKEMGNSALLLDVRPGWCSEGYDSLWDYESSSSF